MVMGCGWEGTWADLFNLPGAPGFVAESPVLDVVRFFAAVFAAEVGVVGVLG